MTLHPLHVHRDLPPQEAACTQRGLGEPTVLLPLSPLPAPLLHNLTSCGTLDLGLTAIPHALAFGLFILLQYFDFAVLADEGLCST